MTHPNKPFVHDLTNLTNKDRMKLTQLLAQAKADGHAQAVADIQMVLGGKGAPPPPARAELEQRAKLRESRKWMRGTR